MTQTLSADGEQYELVVMVTDLRVEANAGSVHLNVSLLRAPGVPGRPQVAQEVLTTGVTVPLGQTVVLGTSATDGGQRALILTVKPQLTGMKTAVKVAPSPDAKN